MSGRATGAGLVIAAALADAAGSHGLAFYALLAAIPIVAIASLVSFGELLDRTATGPLASLQAVLWAVILVLVVVGSAVRSPSLGEGRVPAVAASALAGCLAVLAVQAALAIGLHVRRRVMRALRARKAGSPLAVR